MLKYWMKILFILLVVGTVTFYAAVSVPRALGVPGFDRAGWDAACNEYKVGAFDHDHKGIHSASISILSPVVISSVQEVVMFGVRVHLFSCSFRSTSEDSFSQ